MHVPHKSLPAHMRGVLHFIVLVVVAVSGSTALAQDLMETLIGGVWTADQRSGGRLGESVAFHRDGRLSYGYGPVLDMQYTEQGRTIQTTLPDPTNIKNPIRFAFEFTEDGLLVLDGDVPAYRMELSRAPEFRAGASRSLVNAWDFKHPLGVPGRMRFSSDGRAQMLVYFRRSDGTFTVEGDTVTIQLKGREPRTLTLDRSSGKLMLPALPGEAATRDFSHFVVR